VDGLDEAVAKGLRALLDEADMRHEDLARAMTNLGFRWNANRVTQIVTGRRPMSLLELAGVYAVLRRPVGDLVGDKGEVELPGGWIEVALVQRALTRGGHAWVSKRKVESALRDAFAEREEAGLKAAKRLGRTAAEIDAASRKLWGLSLAAERDRRVEERADEPSKTPRALQARRGHVTRALVEELRRHFELQAGSR
jgi:hypothetical protein